MSLHLLLLANYYDYDSIQQLDLSNQNITTLPNIITQCNNLHSIDLSHNNKLALSSLSCLNKLPNLTTLNLSDCNIIDFNELPVITSLTKLHLITPNINVSADDCVVLAQKCPNLQHLILHANQSITNADTNYLTIKNQCIELFTQLQMYDNILCGSTVYEDMYKVHDQINMMNNKIQHDQQLYSANTTALQHTIQNSIHELYRQSTNELQSNKYCLDETNIKQLLNEFHVEMDRVDQLIAHNS